MQITDLLDKKSIYLGAKVSSKEETLDRAVALMAESGKIADVETYKKGEYAREEEGTPGIGEGIAIPHAKTAALKAQGLAGKEVAYFHINATNRKAMEERNCRITHIKNENDTISFSYLYRS